MLKHLKLAWDVAFGDPNRALLKENARLRAKLRTRRQALRTLNRSAEFRSLVVANLRTRLERHKIDHLHLLNEQQRQLDEQRAKIDALTQALAEERAKNGVQPVTQ